MKYKKLINKNKFYPPDTNLVRFGYDPFLYKTICSKSSKGATHIKIIPLLKITNK